MGSNTVLVNVVRLRAALALVVLLSPSLSRSVFAQAELVGTWAPRNTEDISRDSYPVDYLGLPLNDEGRLRALSYNEAQLAMVERQCQGWPPFYFVQGPFGLKIWSENEPVKGPNCFRDGKHRPQVQVRRGIAHGLTEVQESDFGLGAFRNDPGQVQRPQDRIRMTVGSHQDRMVARCDAGSQCPTPSDTAPHTFRSPRSR